MTAVKSDTVGNETVWSKVNCVMHRFFVRIQEMQMRRAEQRIRNKVYF